MTSRLLFVTSLATLFACGGGSKPASTPTTSMEANAPVATAAPAETAAAPAAPATATPAPADSPKYTFAVKELAVGTVIDFSRKNRHQMVPLKDGKPGTAVVTERLIAGTVTVKELDAAKKLATAVEVTFAATSTEAPWIAGTTGVPSPAFYAGKKFLVKKAAGAALEIQDEKGKPVLKNDGEVRFVGAVVAQIVPFGAFGYNHGLPGRLGGRTLGLGDKVDDLIPFMPTMLFERNRTIKFASLRDGQATFEMHGDDSRESQNKEGAVTFRGASQGDARLSVPVATSLWTTLVTKRAGQSERVGASTEMTWEDQNTVTRTFR
ncbi:MAG: hypothetical protein HOO96_38560 [Polyangiaceae bacterium]|nr:hypothetical protein [Polyangiaceae bacterium]